MAVLTQILRAVQHRRMLWKNGGGETTEIMVWPEGAGLDDFGWRVSMARVTQDGPFSAFTGIDRTLVILEGEGLRLDIEGSPPVELRRNSTPHSFPADATTGSVLFDGPVTDLNVMTRRGVFAHTVERLEVSSGSTRIPVPANEMLLVCHRGSVEINGGEHLAPLDCLWVKSGDALDLCADQPAFLFRIDICTAYDATLP